MNASQQLDDCTKRTFACFDATLFSAPEQDHSELFAIRRLLTDLLGDDSHPLIQNNGKMYDAQHFLRYGELATHALQELHEKVQRKRVQSLLGKTLDWFHQVLGKGTQTVSDFTIEEATEPDSETYVVINDTGRREVFYKEKGESVA